MTASVSVDTFEEQSADRLLDIQQFRERAATFLVSKVKPPRFSSSVTPSGSAFPSSGAGWSLAETPSATSQLSAWLS
jgi:hypothetical protein